MATEKILNTRIKLRYDTYDAWHLANPTLLKGEVAIVELPSNPTNTDHGVNPPATLIKVGPGSFNSLPFLSATAADVHAWAKKTEDQFKAWVKGLIPADVTDTESGKFIVGMTMTNDANGIHATISRADVDWTDIQNKPDLATAAQGAKADSAVQSVAITGGTNNGTLKLTVDGTATDNIAVTGLGSAAFTEASAYANAAQGQAADNAAAKLVGIDTTVVDYVADAIEGVTGGDITVDTAKNYDETTGTIKAKFEEIETAIEAAKDYADENDTNTAHTHSAGAGLKLTGNGGIDGDTKYELNLDFTLKDGDIVLHEKDNAKNVIATLGAAELLEDSYLDDVDIKDNVLEFTWKMDDGSKKTDSVDLTHLVDVYTGKDDGTTIKVTVDKYEISAEVKEGSIGVAQLDGNVNSQLEYTVQLCDSIGQNQTIEKANSAVQPGDLGSMAGEDKSNYKTKQTAVTDPAASGETLAFIDTIAQDTNGVITATKKNVNLNAYALKTDIKDGQLNFSASGGLTTSGDTQFSANQADDSNFNISIADKGVTTDKIDDGAVTTDKIADKAVTTAKIADHAVGAAQIKAEQGYAGADAEVWVFDCGGAL